MHLTEPTVQNLEAVLSSAVSDALSSLRLEVQDDGEFLLVTGVLKPYMSDDHLKEILEKMRAIVSPRVPPETDRMTWMIVLKEGGAVRDVCESEVLFPDNK
jgi:hypothetical protein